MKKTLVLLLIFSVFLSACHGGEKQKIIAVKTEQRAAQQLNSKKRVVDSTNKKTKVDYLNEIP